MAERREVRCGDQRYVFVQYEHGVLGIFDAQGRLVVGWPQTSAVPAPLDALDDAELCALVAKLGGGGRGR